MPLTRTTLTAAIKAGDTLLPVASTATGFPSVGLITNPQQLVMIDEELMYLVQVPSINTILVRSRGTQGTAVAHDIGSSVATSTSTSDFPELGVGGALQRPLSAPDVVTYGQDGAIAPPGATAAAMTMALLAKATAGAYTLAAPSLALTGVVLVLTSQTAAAHVVTATALYNTGAAGGPFSTATFPAQIGAALTLIASNGLWNVQNTNGAIVFA